MDIHVHVHMEHLNRECKNALSALGSNMTDHPVKHVGKCIGKVVSILHHIDQANAILYQSGCNPHHYLSEDIKKIIQLLTTSCVSTVQEGRYHCTFPNFKNNLMSMLSKSSLKQWMQERQRKLITYH